MDVEIPQDVHDIATRLGGGVPYALKAVAGQLVDDPDLGHPSGLPGILTVRIEDDVIEDCPALAIGYIREPDRIQIRFLTLARPAEPLPETETEPEEEPEERPDPVAEATTARQVADAWRRITSWLRDHAPDSYAALRPGAGLGTLAALEGELGIRLPVELRVLWTLTAGDDGGCLPGNRALMPVDAVADVHRLKTDIQAGLDVDNAGLCEEDRITAWAPTRIPVVAFGPADTTSGLYLDAATGYLGRWSRYNEPPRRRTRHPRHLLGGDRRHARSTGPRHPGQTGARRRDTGLAQRQAPHRRTPLAAGDRLTARLRRVGGQQAVVLEVAHPVRVFRARQRPGVVHDLRERVARHGGRAP
ncbi:hypothetical protein PV682_17355 [Streptomyces niveiscabiei]|uniref:hypothetical protein n=1 Tax=Streptomyces niveiscabiei TaxID=164115 RepID=UPI0029BBC3CF|nr:hypothetical protein [Streptomyces niveiscabiei]MDX3383222.1 hypothetical protein [Streptomyces niveiscabiei]